MTTKPMACPIDGTTLVMSERQGIEIDYCPACRGVWLDRGELDKIIEKSAADGPQAPVAPQAPAAPQAPHSGPWGAQPPHPGHHPDSYGHGYGYKPYKRRKSFLEELFD